MEVFEIIIILGILFAQVCVAYLAWGQIESISHFLSSEDSLELKQINVDLNENEKHQLDKSHYIGVVNKIYCCPIKLENSIFTLAHACA